jgi:predicted ribosome quality control (RQC) complex YloA/Tae2 family protein
MSLDGFNAAALLNELRPLLARARLQKFSQLTEDAFLLHLRCPGRTDKLLISLHQDRSRFHLIQGSPPAAIVPNSFVMLCRKHVGGTWLTGLVQHGLDRRVEFQFGSGMSLVFDWAGRPSCLLLIKTEERTTLGIFPSKGRFRRRDPYLVELPELPSPIEFDDESAWQAMTGQPPESYFRDALDQVNCHWSPLWKKRFQKMLGIERMADLEEHTFRRAWNTIIGPLRDADDSGQNPHRAGIEKDGELTYCAAEPTFETLQQAAQERWLDSSLAPGVSDFRDELLKRLKKSRDKAARKLEKRRQDRKGAESAPRDQMKGDLLLAYASGLKRGDDRFDTTDWDGRPVSITLDPRLNAHENAERFYNKAKKKRRALSVLEEQIQKAESEIEMWAELIFAAQTSENQTDLEQVRQSMPDTQRSQKRRKVPQAPTSGPRRFFHNDFHILVGRNPTQNDKLSLKTAAKDDHWFHVRQGAGSHVLIRTAGAEPPVDTVRAAAWLAAKFSQAANSKAVEVVTTRARFLKKPKGGPLGKVIYRQETEIVVDPTGGEPEGLNAQNKNEFAE